MDLIIGSTDQVTFSVPSGVATATFTVTDSDTTSANQNAVIADGIASCEVPYTYLVSPGNIRVDLTFTYQSGTHTKTEFVNIVKPYIELYMLKGMYPDKSDAQLIELENIARQRIEAYCGQDFNYYPDTTYYIVSNGDKALELERRLIRLEALETDGSSVPGNLELSDYYITLGDIWLGMKDAPPEYVYEGVIRFPYLDNNYRFGKNRLYAVTGDWGFESVPGPVISAMKTLIKHYSSRVAEMQETNIKSAKAADWALSFGDGAAIETTGNYHADALLDNYVVPGWQVV